MARRTPTMATTRTARRPPASEAGRGDGRSSGPPTAPPDRVERKTQVLTQGSASTVSSIADAVVIKQGEPFFLCPPDGQIETHGRHGFGLYHHDTRYLSGYEVRMAGVPLDSLAAAAVTGAEAVLELTNPVLSLDGDRVFPKERLGVRWTRHLRPDRPCLVDRIEIRSYAAKAARLPLRLSFAADFRDVFAVRGLLAKRPGELVDPRWDGRQLVFEYAGADDVDRSLTVAVDRDLAGHDATGLDLSVDLPARGTWAVKITLTIGESVRPGGRPLEQRARHGGRATPESKARAAQQGAGQDEPRALWRTTVATESLALDAALHRSLADLVTLRDELDGRRYYAAGTPWFSTLFGRDSLIAAYQTLAFEPTVAADTLRLLASRQGSHDDDWRDEAPGRILHELRVGELARLHEIPHTPYFGSIDSTPLFLILLARHAAWTGSLGLFHELRDNVDRALDWLASATAGHDRGYLAYDSTTNHGLVNQGWKDSGDAIVMADGTTAKPPIALAEVQGYVHAAKRGIADLFERDGDAGRAAALRKEADTLRDRFDRDFWSEQLGCYVLAVARGGAPCEVVSSNAGQVLWGGIAAGRRVATVAERLMADDMFGGWGIRTLSARATAFNPVGYHLGTVWPHDNALIAEGFRRYGLDDAAERIFSALLEAAQDFPQRRLPECFAGFARGAFGVPVRYPIACHPQAWAAGALPHLLVSILGLEPDAFAGRLRVVRPRLPDWVPHLELRGLPLAGGTIDLAFDCVNGRTTASALRIDGDIDVSIEP